MNGVQLITNLVIKYIFVLSEINLIYFSHTYNIIQHYYYFYTPYMILKQKQGYPLYVKGTLKIFDNLKLHLTTNILVPKLVPISVPFAPKLKQITPLLEPIIHLQIIDENIREQVMKQKYQLKPQTFYIYFPSEFRVDQKIYKTMVKNYQNLIDQIPRNIRPNVHKYILFQQGKGQHSLQHQKNKINQSISELSRIQIQTKLHSLTTEISQYRSQTITPKTLYYIFILKNKLACLYSYLQLNAFASDLLSDLWNLIMINFRCLMNLPPSFKTMIPKLDEPVDIPKSPYIIQNINDILGYFLQSTQSTAYLRIVTHAFYNFYIFSLALGHFGQGISKLKYFLDYILNNVLVLIKKAQWAKQQMIMFDIARNLWVVEVAIKCLQQFQHHHNNSVNNKQLSNNYHNNSYVQGNHISVCSMLRNSVERIGLLLYKFDNFSIFPSTTAKQLEFIYQKMNGVKEPWKNNKMSIESIGSMGQDDIFERKSSIGSISRRKTNILIQIPQIGPNQLKLRQLVTLKFVITQQVNKILASQQTFNQVYLKILQIMHESLKNSSYSRVACSLKITLQKATIMLGDWQHLQQFPNQPQVFKNIWPTIDTVELLYKFFFLFIKILSSKNYGKQLCQLSIQILKNNALMQNQQHTLSIISLAYQILQKQGINCVIGNIQSIQINSQNKIKFTIKGNDIQNIINIFNKIYLSTQQIMLNEGVKNYELLNCKFKQYKKCVNCKGECGENCTYLGQNYTEIVADISIQNNQQAIFYINQILLAKTVNDTKISLHIEKKDGNKKILQQINIPKLNLTNQNDIIYSQIWTPLVFKLQNILEPTILCKIEANIKSQFLQENKIQIQAQNKNIDKNLSIAQLVFVHKQNQKSMKQIKNGKQSKNYYKMQEKIDLKLEKDNDCQYQITIFTKSLYGLGKIKRNSQRKMQQYLTHQYIELQLTLKIAKTNKQYTLKFNTKPLKGHPLFLIEYNLVQTCQQFKLTNTSSVGLEIHEENANSFVLEKEEQISIVTRLLMVAPLQYSIMKTSLNFNDWFDPQYLLQKQGNTFKIWYKTQHNYKCFEPIQIQSQIIGYISIPGLQNSDEKGFQVIGKIGGQVSYLQMNQTHQLMQKQNKLINLWLVPIRSGNIVLPQIWINGKRGIWTNSLITNIKCS